MDARGKTLEKGEPHRPENKSSKLLVNFRSGTKQLRSFSLKFTLNQWLYWFSLEGGVLELKFSLLKCMRKSQSEIANMSFFSNFHQITGILMLRRINLKYPLLFQRSTPARELPYPEGSVSGVLCPQLLGLPHLPRPALSVSGCPRAAW